MTDDEVLAFVRTALASVWDIELLSLLRRAPQRGWSAAEIDRELRASPTVVGKSLRQLSACGLIAGSDEVPIRYAPANQTLDDFARALEALYRSKPTSVINAVTAGRNDKLKTFSDAFKLKKD